MSKAEVYENRVLTGTLEQTDGANKHIRCLKYKYP